VVFECFEWDCEGGVGDGMLLFCLLLV
jgi:hypothetical protein